MQTRKEMLIMGRKKVDRSNKVIQSFETTRPLKVRLEELAKKRNLTVSALIREILERYFEERN
jgi:predicted DNA-binding protein